MIIICYIFYTWRLLHKYRMVFIPLRTEWKASIFIDASATVIPAFLSSSQSIFSISEILEKASGTFILVFLTLLAREFRYLICLSVAGVPIISFVSL